ncbi:MAG: hypothetical protein A2915_04390 [Candidatus Yanofskybacteria bacterium RIFCSPLOWO2_01_FULL_41_34]|uniref:Uncharacterized protein n=1 Tax=Candidatus Yanofskybacteria bacterium RIFCSPHIGHO2_01_FULL_41_26 TaxID=1802661 RepID=A0A1F8EC51_9BACT|nr:MAG: hypothetical protein A2649_03490 [Candidatus Yanofskybacteria bacterium RIFCSPHIGHO2_01_FULL_41_26]OGN21640.1 MAG: hypothetical protein A2915_04390 [Candidatus Yanofskybacteria bacterium RIFCSPLOWO2_01_FULL_41_34]
MRKDQEKAFGLRRQKQSYKTISKELGIPKSTLAGWFKNELWSQDIRDELGRTASLAFPEKLNRIVAANKKRWADWHQQARDEAVVEFPKLKDDSLFLAGLMLYWGEGNKTPTSPQVKLANSDPAMIRLFCLFLKKTLLVPDEKIKIWLLLYPDLIDSVQKNFWSKATGIPLTQFNKSIYIKGRRSTRRLSYGVCNVTVSSRQLKEKIVKWIELFQLNLQESAFLKKTLK